MPFSSLKSPPNPAGPGLPNELPSVLSLSRPGIGLPHLTVIPVLAEKEGLLRKTSLAQAKNFSKSHLLEKGERPAATMNQGNGKPCGSKFTTATLSCRSLFITKGVVVGESTECSKKIRNSS
ncbi:uncharacterized protein G2W53_001877 [Senna tora]|uniref:Uncharacterized protein n=1 Tax=Senna tora TaxID=362788 RepID=A0A834XJL8_9FABA|nr:uncharacterized protein G2W53_001877 [Senna tora]